MKKLKRIASIFVIGVILLVVGGRVGVGLMWKAALEKYGEKVTEVPVTVGRVWVNPFAGTIQIGSLEVGNPNGFKSPRALIARQVNLQVEWRSLFASKTVIRSLAINGLEVTYERALLQSNLGVISKTVRSKINSPETLSDRLRRQVQADEVLIAEGKVNLSATLLGGRGVGLSLPEIRMRDLGKDADGITIAELASEILRALLENINPLAPSEQAGPETG